MSRVDIGFVDDADPSTLKSHFFPSKIGGKPAWLSLKGVPSTEDLTCENCGQQYVFLGQVYAPFEEDPDNFHRTIFVFICRNPNCCKSNDSSNIKVWRSQLRKKNEFYSEKPPDKNTVFEVDSVLRLCTVCGCPATKHCSKCKNTFYCTRDHQVSDWKCGHKNYCQDRTSQISNEVLFTEMELVIEEEEAEEKKEVDEEKCMEEFEKLVLDGGTGSMNEVSEEDLLNHASVDKDKPFLQFKKRIAKNPEQVLRYNKGGRPLWLAAEPKPKYIPVCEYCACERQFEFQILPQLLFELKEDKLDWGTIVVYTCKNSCTIGPLYKKEFVFKQDVSN